MKKLTVEKKMKFIEQLVAREHGKLSINDIHYFEDIFKKLNINHERLKYPNGADVTSGDFYDFIFRYIGENYGIDYVPKKMCFRDKKEYIRDCIFSNCVVTENDLTDDDLEMGDDLIKFLDKHGYLRYVAYPDLTEITADDINDCVHRILADRRAE